MKLGRRIGAGVAGGLVIIAPLQSAYAQKAAEKPVSLHVQCDGMPNNMSAGESAARLIGAVTLLALFAPPPESADPSKRKFGAEGVAVCTTLLEGDRKETNANRRLGLLLARAIHQIEAKNYDAAIADAALARREAEASGMMADPYFARTRGRSFDLIEAAALLRSGKPAEASDASLRSLPLIRYSLVGQLTTIDYGALVRRPSETELQSMDWRSRLYPGFAYQRAERLELLGRFADAARVRDALVDFDRSNTPDADSSIAMAQAAISNALAGNRERAAQLIADARANAQKRRAAGKPEENESGLVELFDLYGIVDMSATDPKGARRLFAARSEWVGASFGAVLEVTRRLREGATSDELIGGLSRDPDQLWKDHADAEVAQLTATDSDNKTLFRMMLASYPASAYEAMTKPVWNTQKSKLVLTPTKDSTSKLETLFLYGYAPPVALDGYLLHAALLARSRGHQGFVFAPIFLQGASGASIRTGNRGDAGLPDDLFVDAADVIAQLSPIIPDPDTLKARRAKR